MRMLCSRHNLCDPLVEAKHFFQEDDPSAVGTALRDWALRLRPPPAQR